MKSHFLYLRYVLIHKWFVFWACMEYRLVWRGIKHDWTKFLPVEWFPYVEYFYGRKRPDVGTTGYSHQLHQDDTAFNYAWNHHQKANSHHWQYYVLNYDDGRTMVLDMPLLDRMEMIADWRGAGMAQGKPRTWEWYEANKDKMQLSPDTRVWVEEELAKLKFVFDWRVRRLFGELSTSDIVVMKKDANAIGLDWIAVGKDIENATQRFKEENKL